MKKLTVILFALFSIPLSVKCQPSNYSTVEHVQGFTENKGQILNQDFNPNPMVKFLLSCNGFNLQLKGAGFSYDIYQEQSVINHQTQSDIRIRTPYDVMDNAGRFRFDRIDVEIVGCNLKSVIVPSDTTPFIFNYITDSIGHTLIHTYKRVTYLNVYPSIDLEFLCDEGNQVKYNFIVHPGGNVDDIKLKYNCSGTPMLKDQSINIVHSQGTFVENIPISFWAIDNRKISVEYVQIGSNTFGFKADFVNWNGTSDLIIDPIPCLDWGTYFGGTGTSDEAHGIAIDDSGYVYVSGYVESISAIATNGAYQNTFGGGFVDAFIAKFDSSGTSLLWATYYGGAGNNGAYSIVLDDSSNIYIGGWSDSLGSITTSGSFQLNYGGGNFDAFVAKFNSSGTVLDWASYFGGTGDDYCGYGIVLDITGNVFIAGTTSSSSGISTPGAFQGNFGGYIDAFITCINPSGSSIVWSTYYGGSGDDNINGLTIDSSQDVFVTGHTSSLNNIATAGAYRTFKSGSYDVFVSKIHNSGSLLMWGTYYAGSSMDVGYHIEVGLSGNIYISGWTASNLNVATSGAYQNFNAGIFDGFLAKFNSTGANLMWGTYYGGAELDQLYSFELDTIDNIYVVGYSLSPSGIATSNAWQTVWAGDTSDIIVAKFDSTGSVLHWGTYYGGSEDDFGNSLVLTRSGNIVIAGYTESTNAISTVGSYQTTNGGGNDVVIARFGCMVTSARDILMEESISVYPNPATSNVHFQFGGSSTGTITVHNPIGQIIRVVQFTGTSQVEVELNGMVAGLYTYVVAFENTEISTGKFIIN